MKWKSIFAIAVLALAVSACAITGDLLGGSPEAQIANGANTGKAATATGRVLLSAKKITPTQARSYVNILDAAAAHMHDTNNRLLACRAATKSTPKSNPDPCVATVGDDLRLGLRMIGDVQRTLDAK